MPLVPENVFPESVLEKVLENPDSEKWGPNPRVRQYPFMFHLLKMEPDRSWNPKPDCVGAGYIITEGDTDHNPKILIYKDNEMHILDDKKSRLDQALFGAIAWADSRDLDCHIRILDVPSWGYAFWVLDGAREVFFPIEHGFLVSGPEFAASLKALSEGIESTDWSPWEIEEYNESES